MATIDELSRRSWKSFFVAGNLLRERVEESLAAADLGTLSEYDALYTLSQADSLRLSMSELTASLTLTQSGLSRLIDRLVRQGLVERGPHETDRRVVQVFLTPLGQVRVDAIWEIYQECIRIHFAERLEPSDHRELMRLMAILATPLIQHRESTRRYPFLHQLEDIPNGA